MSVFTVIGQLATASHGFSRHSNGIESELFSLPAAGYQHRQRSEIPIKYEHDPDVALGSVVHLQRSAAVGLVMVGTVEGHDELFDRRDERPWYLSAGVSVRPSGPAQFGHAEIFEVSLVRVPAAQGTRPVKFARHDIRIDGGGQPAGQPMPWREVWERAHTRAAAARWHVRAFPLFIFDQDRQEVAAPPPEPVAAASTRYRAEDDNGRVFRHRTGGWMAPVVE